MKNNKFKITAVIVLWLITLAVPFVMYNIPHENQNGGLVSEYEVEYKGDTYRCIDMYPDFSEFESKEKIWSCVMKNFWLVKNENGEEFICVSQYGEDFLCAKTSDKPARTNFKIVTATTALAIISLAVTVIILRKNGFSLKK
ncbi:MAG: hypothetical protein IKK09_10025 [Clostridia bacterium]|nr:hypothetical protein [Clostridia bacterium]